MSDKYDEPRGHALRERFDAVFESIVEDGGENRFGVSDEAMAWRLYNLGLTSERPA